MRDESVMIARSERNSHNPWPVELGNSRAPYATMLPDSDRLPFAHAAGPAGAALYTREPALEATAVL
eukprot:362396-Chlamydomonas_euryale.AAC.2